MVASYLCTLALLRSQRLERTLGAGYTFNLRERELARGKDKAMRKMLPLLVVLLSPLAYLASFLFMAFLIVVTMWENIFRRDKRTISKKEERPFEQWEKKRAFLERKDIRECSACSNWMREFFSTETEYLGLDLQIEQQAFKHLKTIPGGFSNPKYEFMGVGVGGRTFWGAEIYACRRCGQIWELSVPDMAHRGYFKPIEAAMVGEAFRLFDENGSPEDA
jgi:hypothetical protein